MKDAAQLRNALVQFTGTGTWWRHGLNRSMLYTDGVQYFAEQAGGGAYWFLDIVATELMDIHKREEFINIVMLVKDKSALITADDGNNNELWRRAIKYTDCPSGRWQFYLENKVVCLPSER